MKKSILFPILLLSGSLVLADVLGIALNQNPDSVVAYNDVEVANNPKQFIGYGYNVAGGKSICETDALFLNNPILNINSKDVLENTKVFNASQTIYMSDTATSASQIAGSYGTQLSGGINANVSIVNVNVGAKFNTSTSWTKTQKEEYSYFSIFAKNKPVILQMDITDIRNNLSNKFYSDLISVKDDSSAAKLFEKYGTHLLTGYTLGGIFEMTNYYATNSSSYVKQNNTSFSAQVGVAISSYGASTDFSFSQSYGMNDNNSYAVNNYKCQTYGGLTFPGLTIDQAFSWYETLTGAGYVYDIWTDSINNGQNLVIVDVPQSSQMIPLWDLLPLDSQFNKTREFLISRYITNCGGAFKKFKSEWPTVYITDRTSNSTEMEYEIEEKGFTIFNNVSDSDSKSTVKYIDTSTNKSYVYSVSSGSTVAMNYIEDTVKEQDVRWYVDEADLNKVEFLDDRTGVFKVIGSAGDKFTIRASVNGIPAFSGKQFKISVVDKYFSGDGSESNPFLISNAEQFVNFTSDPRANDVDNKYYFKLINDIDLTTLPSNLKIQVVGPHPAKPFTGVFDGNNHIVYGIDIDYSDWEVSNVRGYLGLFGYNKGTIKNLSIQQGQNQIRPTLKNHPGSAYIGDLEYEKDLINSQSKPYYYKGQLITNTEIKEQIANSLFRGNIRPISYASILCAYNSTAGTIENCFIENADVSLDNQNELESDKSEDIYVGGVCAYNAGTITDCHISESQVTGVAFKYSRGYLGGICGYNASGAVIRKSSAAHSYLCAKISNEYLDKTQNRESAVGGVCGYTDGTLTDCLATNFCLAPQSTANDEFVPNGNSAILSMVFYHDFDHSHVEKAENFYYGASAGGVFGYSFSGNITKCVSAAINPSCVNCRAYYLSGGSGVDRNVSSEWNGIFAGRGRALSIENCYVQDFPNGPIIGNLLKTDDGFIENFSSSDIAVGSDNTYYSLPEAIYSDGAWDSNSENYIQLRKTKFNRISSNIDFDTSEVKKNFFVGDAFNANNIVVTGTYDDGTEFPIEEFTVDYSEYENNKDVEATSTVSIYLTAYGITSSYQVTISVPDSSYIYVKKGPDEVYYEGDGADNELTFSGMEVYCRRENGTEFKLNEDEYVVSYGTFVPGDNQITVSYPKEGFSCDYYVKAEEMQIESVEVMENTIDQSKMNFVVGSSNIDLGNTKVKIVYEAKNMFKKTKVVSWDKCELIYARITKGINEIKVFYGGYEECNAAKKNIIVNGIVQPDSETLNAFISSVNNIKVSQNLSQKFENIKKAQQYLSLLGDYTDTNVENAKADLTNAIDEYNAIVSDINNNFGNSFVAVNSFVQPFAKNGNFSLLELLITILMRLFN